MTDTRKPRPGGEVVVYEGPDGEVALDVRLEQETVWLTREQMAAVFTSTTENIRQHLRNIFVDSELEESATTKDFLVVRSEGDRRVQRRIRHYNLDAIISVGYRTLRNQALVEDTGRAVLELVTRYADTWRLLLEYDEDRLEAPAGTRPPSAALDHEQAVAAIADFRAALIARGEASPLFGNPRGEALEGILGNVEQTMFGEPLYRTREEKAANLLYFLVKDHVGPSDRELAGGAGGVSSFAESEVETAALETGGGAWADDRGGVCAVLAGGGSENLWQPVARKEDQRS